MVSLCSPLSLLLFAICHSTRPRNRSSHLVFSIRYSLFAIRYSLFSICHLPFAICHLLSAFILPPLAPPQIEAWSLKFHLFLLPPFPFARPLKRILSTLRLVLLQCQRR